MTYLIHDRVIRSKTRNENIAIFRWNPVLKQMEVWAPGTQYWRRTTIIEKLTQAVSYRFRIVKWMYTWTEPFDGMES